MAPAPTQSIDRNAPTKPSMARKIVCALALFALAFAIALPGNGARRPLDAHEAFVARTAVEMERRGEFIVPYFRDEQRLQKPPLSYWLAMGCARILGNQGRASQTELSARLPSITLGAATTVLTAWLGWILFDSFLIGVLAAILFATNIFYVVWARCAQPEMAYTFSCTLFLLSAALARRAALAGRSTWCAAMCAWAAVALAILSKGPILPVLFLVGAAIAMRKRAGGPGFLRTLHLPAGLLLMLALVVPYFALVVQRVPGAIEFWRSQMFDRTGGIGRAWWQPLEMFYVGQALGNWMPWSLLLIFVPIWFWRTRRAQRQGELDADSLARWSSARFLGWCALVPCIALSFSAGRKGYYLLPTFPLWALLMAWAAVTTFQRACAMKEVSRGLLRVLRAHAAMFAALMGGMIWLVTVRRSWLGLGDALFISDCAVLVLAIVLAGIAFSAARGAPQRSAVLLFACTALGAFAAGLSGIHSRIRLYTTGEFARAVALAADPKRPLLVIGGDSQVLLFYTDRPVTPLSAQELPSELAKLPLPLIVQDESQLHTEGVVGRVLVREQRSAGVDPMLLVDPSLTPQEESPGERQHGAR